ncbi:hypothetical protein [Nonomuraea sp. NPDC052265]
MARPVVSATMSPDGRHTAPDIGCFAERPPGGPGDVLPRCAG